MAVATLPSFMFMKFKLQNNFIDFNGVGLVDTGSNFGLIQKSLLKASDLQRIKPIGTKITGVGGDINVVGSIIGTVTLGDAIFDSVRFDVVDFITDSVQCILGMGIFMHPSVQNFCVDQPKETITFVQSDYRLNTVVKTEVKYLKPLPKIQSVATTVLKDVDIKNKPLREKLEYLKREKQIEIYHENRDYVEQFVNMILEHLQIFSDGDLGCYPEEVEIKTQGDPISVRQHAVAQEFQSSVDEHIKDMLAKGVIEPCSDPKGWNSPIICVAEKDKTCRVCINLKNTVNKRLCQPDPFPTISVDEVFNDISDGCRFFSSMDFHKGYWQLKLTKNCRHLLAFTWGGVCYNFVRLPFGFTAAGSIFSRAIQNALNSANFNRAKDAFSAHLIMTELPVHNAGANFHEAIINGKFQGMMAPMTPIGSR